MEVISKTRATVTWVNKTEFPSTTSWRDMHKAGEKEYPGSTTRICTPGEILQGEEVPSAFNGKFLCEEYDIAVVLVKEGEQREFEESFRKKTPVVDGDYGAWYTAFNEARYHHFRGKFFYENPRYMGCRVRFSFEVVSCLDEADVA